MSESSSKGHRVGASPGNMTIYRRYVLSAPFPGNAYFVPLQSRELAVGRSWVGAPCHWQGFSRMHHRCTTAQPEPTRGLTKDSLRDSHKGMLQKVCAGLPTPSRTGMVTRRTYLSVWSGPPTTPPLMTVTAGLTDMNESTLQQDSPLSPAQQVPLFLETQGPRIRGDTRQTVRRSGYSLTQHCTSQGALVALAMRHM